MRIASSLLAVALAAACSDTVASAPETPRPHALQPVQGNLQSAVVGETLPEELQVRVLDQNGTPMPGVPVVWSTISGTVRPPESLSDQEGIARARWQLGKQPGAVTATAQLPSGPPAVFTASAVPLPPKFFVELRAPATVQGTRLASGELECAYPVSAHAFGGAAGDYGVWRYSIGYWTRSDGVTRNLNGGNPADWLGSSTIRPGEAQNGSKVDRWDAPFTVTHVLVYDFLGRTSRGVSMTVTCTE